MCDGRHLGSILRAVNPRTTESTAFDLQPTLVGDLLELRPIRPDDFDALYAVASDPKIWEQHPERDRWREERFRVYFEGAIESRGGLIAIDRRDGSVIGASRYHAYDPAHSEIEIGYTFLARSKWGGRYNGEMKRLMLDHAFRFVTTVVFLIGEDNWRSRKAVEKIGGVYAGTRIDWKKQERVVYAITADAWRRRTQSVLQAIGNTSLVCLQRVVPAGAAEVWVKLEWENPTGSMKDRMARAVIERAEADGRLQPGGSVVEYTGGSAGASLALVCAAKGYPIRLVTSEAFSREKRDQMEALGAALVLVPSEGGLTTKKLILDMIEEARRWSAEPGVYWTDQLNNKDTLAGYDTMGEEIWEQTHGRVDAFVHSVGTAASIRGAATALKRHDPKVHVAAVEPAESAVLSGGAPGAHKIEGVGIGYTPPLWDPSVVDEIIPIGTADAKEMARRLAREEGVFAGTSSAANVLAAIRVAQRLGAGRRVVTLMVDSGLKYVSTDVYRRE